MKTRFLSILGTILAPGLLIFAAACSSSSQTTNDANANQNGGNGGNGGTTNQPVNNNSKELTEADGLDGKFEALVAGLSEAMGRLEKKGIDVVSVQNIRIESPQEMIARINAPISTHDWLPERLAYGHRDEYLSAKADSIRNKFREIVVNSGVDLAADSDYSALDDIIFGQQGIEFDPQTTNEIGARVGVKGVLFAKITASFDALRPYNIYRMSKYWVKGNYQFEARLVNVEEGTIVWLKTENWVKTFTIER